MKLVRTYQLATKKAKFVSSSLAPLSSAEMKLLRWRLRTPNRLSIRRLKCHPRGCRALASRMMKPHKTPLLLQFLSLGVVEAASSSLVTQTRKREMSNLPFFSVFMGLFRSLKSQNQELSVYLKHAVIVPENRVGTKSGT